MQMQIGKRGRVELIRLGWYGRCRHADPDDPFSFGWAGRSDFRPGGSARRFATTHRHRIKHRENEFVYVRLRIEGRRVSRKRWKGTYRVFTRVVVDGRQVDTCRSRRTVWEAIRRARFRFEVAGSSGDYVTRGKAWSYSSPRYHAWVWGEKGKAANFDMNRYPDGEEDWSVHFAAPYGERLQAGRTYTNAREWEPHQDHPSIHLSGLYHGCVHESGEFTVHDVAFDRRDHVRRLRVSFVHYCDGWGPSRGSVDYTL